MPISPARILYEDEHLLAVNKLSKELVVKGAGKVSKLPLLDFLRKSSPGLHPLHRLDFETSGVVVFARSRKVMQDILARSFAGWTKTYRTIVAGSLTRKEGVIRLPLPSRGSGERLLTETRYRVLERFPVATFLETEIETGRHHQIRRHFAMIGHPLALDDVYGDAKANRRLSRLLRFHRFFLHASRVTFPHPVTGKTLVIEAPPPRAFDAVLERLRKGVRR